MKAKDFNNNPNKSIFSEMIGKNTDLLFLEQVLGSSIRPGSPTRARRYIRNSASPTATATAPNTAGLTRRAILPPRWPPAIAPHRGEDRPLVPAVAQIGSTSCTGRECTYG